MLTERGAHVSAYDLDTLHASNSGSAAAVARGRLVHVLEGPPNGGSRLAHQLDVADEFMDRLSHQLS